MYISFGQSQENHKRVFTIRVIIRLNCVLLDTNKLKGIINNYYLIQI